LNGGKNQSPEFNWTPGPAGTQSYALMLHDLSNVMQGNPFVHWVLWNIPASTTQLPANLPRGAMPSSPAGSSQRSYGDVGYQGSGKCGNVYEFVLYALPTATFSPPSGNQTVAATALKATGAPTATLRVQSGPPECT
jgi:Raf kinase inhibitor-like YbhB/YbcL family protein